MILTDLAKVAVSTALLTALATVADGSSLVIPPGLHPGDQYRIVFYTYEQRDATATDISVYDSFVTSAANAPGSILASLNATWQVIGSTAAVQAYDHIGGNFSTPVYRSDGVIVATNAADLWKGSIDAPISLDEYGSGSVVSVWTGTGVFGFDSYGIPYPLGGPLVYVCPNNYMTDANWTAGWPDAYPWNPASLYGISSILTVPGSVPEPGSMVLVGLGIAFVVARLRRRG
jgi:hypothetical protein